MSLMENRHDSTTEPKVNTDALRMSDFTSHYSPVEVPPRASLGVRRLRMDPITSPEASRQLPDMQTDMLAPLAKNNTTALRQPVVIRGTRKKRVTTEALQGPLLPKKSRLVMRLATVSLLVFIMLGTLLAVAPVSRGEGGIGGILSPLIGGGNVKSDNMGQLTQEQARATAAIQDGHDVVPAYSPYTGPGSGVVIAGSQLPWNTTGDFYGSGQCTYWAAARYQYLTGYLPTWSGNADSWATGAAQAGWVVSSMPHVPSIIVLPPGAQGAGPVGHVAVVESISNGTVHTSNWNWIGYGQFSYVDFSYPDSGVQFIWHG